MNESQASLNLLQNEIEQLEKKLKVLLDEEEKEKNEHEDLKI